MNNITTSKTIEKKSDKEGFNRYYRTQKSNLNGITETIDYVVAFEERNQPYYEGGRLKGYAQFLATKSIFTRCDELGLSPSDVTIVDTGYGRGALSVYLASKGYNVIGVDISETARKRASELASKLNIGDRCKFLAENLEHTSIDSNSVDFVIGFGALHHFIKYPGVPAEFQRIMKEGAEAYFVDAFGENKLFHIFHDREKMDALGDVILNKNIITDYFSDFELTITPTDWFTMVDKLWQKILPKGFSRLIRSLSKINFMLDRLIPNHSRIALYFSGVVISKIRKPVIS